MKGIVGVDSRPVRIKAPSISRASRSISPTCSPPRAGRGSISRSSEPRSLPNDHPGRLYPGNTLFVTRKVFRSANKPPARRRWPRPVSWRHCLAPAALVSSASFRLGEIELTFNKTRSFMDTRWVYGHRVNHVRIGAPWDEMGLFSWFISDYRTIGDSDLFSLLLIIQ